MEHTGRIFFFLYEHAGMPTVRRHVTLLKIHLCAFIHRREAALNVHYPPFWDFCSVDNEKSLCLYCYHKLVDHGILQDSSWGIGKQAFFILSAGGTSGSFHLIVHSWYSTSPKIINIGLHTLFLWWCF